MVILNQMDDSKIKKLISYWKKSSENDFLTAKDIINKTNRYSGGLFFIHLCLEKKLNETYVRKFKDFAPYTHNLMHLSEKAALPLSEAQQKILSEINEFNLECRYPEEKNLLQKKATKKFSQIYLSHAEELITWISQFSKQ